MVDKCTTLIILTMTMRTVIVMPMMALMEVKMSPQVVKEFLRGEYCLYGGSGWWKYEFCYGKKVTAAWQNSFGIPA